MRHWQPGRLAHHTNYATTHPTTYSLELERCVGVRGFEIGWISRGGVENAPK